MAYITLLFHQLPIGTRFLYGSHMHCKLTRDTAKCVDKASVLCGTVFVINPLAEVQTA